MLLTSCLICARDSDHFCLFLRKNFILPFVSIFSEGPCLIHSMNGDLLRTLEGPENCLKPKLIQASREGHCVIFYENGSFCTFSVNGKLKAAMETDDNIRVSVPYRLLSVCFHLSIEVSEDVERSPRKPLGSDTKGLLCARERITR